MSNTVSPSCCNSPLTSMPCLRGVMVVGLATVVTAIVLGILIRYPSYSHLKVACWSTSAAGSFLCFTAIMISACKNTPTPVAKSSEHLQPKKSVGKAIISEVILRTSEENIIPPVFLSKDDINQLFPTDEAEKFLLIGNSVYPALEDTSLKKAEITLTADQQNLLRKHLNIRDEFPVISSIQISSVVSKEIQASAQVKIEIKEIAGEKSHELKKGFFETTFRNHLVGKLFKNNQTMEVNFEGVKFKVAFSSSSPLFRIGETTQSEFKVDWLLKEEENSIESEDDKNLTIVERLKKLGVGGMPDALNVVFQPFIDYRDASRKAMYELYGEQLDRGVLFKGPPGTGKTSIAKHIGKILGCKDHEIKHVKVSDVIIKYYGDSEKKISEIFTAPEGSSFFIIIMDEIDVLFANRNKIDRNFEQKIISQFLIELDGARTKRNFLLIGLTNRPESIDSAFLRPGRLSQQIEIPLPDLEARKQILHIYLDALIEKKLFEANEFEFTELAKNTEGMSGAEIEFMVKTAKKRSLNQALKGNLAKMTMDDLFEAINRKKK